MVEWFFNYSIRRQCIVFLSSLVVLFEGSLFEWRWLIYWGDFMVGGGGDFPGGNFPRGQLSGGQLSGGAIIQGAIIRGGAIFVGGNYPRTVLLFDVFKHLLLKKSDVLKTCWKSKFLGKKIWRKSLALKSKMVQGIFGKTLFWHYYLQLSFFCKSLSQISFKLFCSRDKRLLSEFLRKWGWFHVHNERFPRYLG